MCLECIHWAQSFHTSINSSKEGVVWASMLQTRTVRPRESCGFIRKCRQGVAELGWTARSFLHSIPSGLRSLCSSLVSNFLPQSPNMMLFCFRSCHVVTHIEVKEWAHWFCKGQAHSGKEQGIALPLLTHILKLEWYRTKVLYLMLAYCP